jgi:anti-sigma factor RsiW
MTAPGSPFDPAELTAYLDGELPAGRAAEVEARLRADADLRAEYEALRRLDAGAREAAAGALFVPAVQLPSTGRGQVPVAGLAATVFALLGLRIASRFIEPLGPSLLLNLLALAVVTGAVLAMAGREGTERGR